MQKGAVEISAAPEAVAHLVEQAYAPDAVGRLELAQGRSVIIERLTGIIRCLAEVSELFQARRRRRRDARVAREPGGDRLLHRLLLSSFRTALLRRAPVAAARPNSI